MQIFMLPLFYIVVGALINWAPEKIYNIAYFLMWTSTIVFLAGWTYYGINADEGAKELHEKAIKMYKNNSDFKQNVSLFMDGLVLLLIVMAGKFVLAGLFAITVLVWLGARQSMLKLGKKLSSKGD